MAKLSLTDLGGGYLSTAAVNANYALIEAAMENTLSRDGTGPNTMSAQLDMNSQRIVNLQDGVNNQDAITLAQAGVIAGVTNPLTQNTVGEALYPDTADETSAGVTTSANYYDELDPRRYGATDSLAVGVGGVDNTQPFTDAMSVRYGTVPVHFRGQVGDLTATNSINGYGYGELLALAGSTACVHLTRELNWGDWNNLIFQNIRLDMLGDSAPRTIHGFMYPDVPSSTEKTLAGRNMFINVLIKHADIGLYQPTGNFGNKLYGCQIANCNFGIWGQDSASPYIMHPGMLQIMGGEISGSRKAAIYLNCDTESSNGVYLQSVALEGNWGHGLYLDGMNLAPDCPVLESVHFENNDSQSNSTIDLGYGRGVEQIRDLMCHDVDMIHINNTHCTEVGFEFNNSMAIMDGVFMNMSSRLQQDANSVVVYKNANLDGITYLADVMVSSLVQQRRASGANGATMMAKVPDRTHIVKSVPGTGVGVYGESFAHSAVDLIGTGDSAAVRTYGPLGLYDYYCKYPNLSASTGYVGELIPLVQNKWYVYTAMIKKEAYDLATVRWQSGTVYLASGGENILDNNVADDEWITIGGVCEFDGTSGNTRWQVETDSGTVPDISLGPNQVVQFDTQAEAIDYFNSGAFYDADSLEYGGTGTLSGGTLAIDFTDEGFQDQPDTLYGVQLTGDDSTTVYPSAKATTGFTINGSATAVVEWRVYRRDL
jgi:hypothetical protein